MGLVDYSDSETSDDETTQQPTTKGVGTTASKQSFQKVVDRSNPSKIKVSLPSATSLSADDAPEQDARPAKRMRTGGGGLLSDLKSFLPAPKRSGAENGVSAAGSAKKIGLGRGLGSGINLRTGAAPAFSRTAPEPAKEETDANEATPDGSGLASVETISNQTPVPEPELKLVGKATMFRPLSVARNKQKKKKPLFVAGEGAGPATSSAAVSNGTSTSTTVAQQESPAPKAKMSLFSITSEAKPQPAVIQTETPIDDIENMEIDAAEDDYAGYENSSNYTTAPSHIQSGPQTLDTIASDLNLDAAARRQLFGRRGKDDNAPINLVNFDTDRQYMANEELRASGETVQHTALRTVQPGKHSLRQLVSSASTQKDALEESWAAGRRNKKEAGNKYGW